MSRVGPKSRAALVRALRESESLGEATRIVRASRDLADDETVALLMNAFNEVVGRGRAPVGEATALASAAAALASVARTPRSRVVADRTAAVAAHLGGRSKLARRHLEAASRALATCGEWMEAGDVQRTLIDVLIFAGDYPAARRAVRRAEEWWARAGRPDARRLGGLELNRGNLHHRLDQLGPALEAYDRARAHFRRARHARLVGSAEFNRANVLASLDRTVEARAGYECARTIFTGEKVPALVAQADYALAGLDLLEGRLEAGIARLQDVKARQRALDDPTGVAHCELDQAQGLLCLNRPFEAERLATNGLAWFRRVGYDAEMAACMGVLAGATLQQGRARGARALFRRAAGIESRRRNTVGSATQAVGEARALVAAGRAREALRIARRAAVVFRREGLRSREARALAVAAEAALAAGMARGARRSAERALALAGSAADLRVELAALLTLARVDEAEGRDGAAYRRLLAAERRVERLRCGVTGEESRLAFATDKVEVYEALVANRLRRGGRAAVRQALRFAERGKARALAERLARHASDLPVSANARVGPLLRRLERLERDLAVAEQRLTEPRRGRGLRGSGAAHLRALTLRRWRTLERLDLEDPGLAPLAGAPLRDPLEALELLEERDLVLEYTVADGFYHLFAAGRDSVEVFPRLVAVEELKDLADLLRFQLGKGVLGERHTEPFGAWIAGALHGYLKRLHALLLAPVDARIAGRRLRIVPHGVLHGLPFHAFERDGTPLIERAVVAYSPSLAVSALLARRGSRGAGKPLVLGVPDGAAPLIEEELRQVLRWLPQARVLRGAKASRRAVMLDHGRRSLLHVACHGFFGENTPWAGALRLGDAWMSLPEVYALQVTADLVVLSGCETGRGTVYSGDEWVGLVRGFLQAGARTVVAALWEVHDRAAVDLMGEFYSALARGVDVAGALAEAQRRTRRIHPEPLSWAPFMVMGDPGLKMTAREAA